MTPEQMTKMRDARRVKSILRAKAQITISDLQANDLRAISDHTTGCEKLFLKAFTRQSMAAAVKAKCIECCNFQKAEVKRCDIQGCPLWRYRPFQVKGDK